MQKDIYNYCYEKYGHLFGANFDEKLVSDACGSIPVVKMTIKPALKFYRIRKNINELQEDVTNTSVFSYPSAKFCTENGRGHIYGHPAFYCSDTIKAAIFEIRPEKNDFLYVSEWNTNSDCQMSLCLNASERSIQSSLFSGVHSFIEKHVENVEFGDMVKKWLSVREEVTKIFLEEFHPYPNASVYCHLMMYLRNVDLIVYPSFQWRDILTNLVLKKEFVDKHLKLSKVYKLEVTEDCYSVSHFSLRKVGAAISNKVVWPSLEQSNADDFFRKFSIDEHTFVLNRAKYISDENIQDLLVDIDNQVIKGEIERYSKEGDNTSKLFSLGLEQIQSANYYDALKYFNQCIELCSVMPTFYYQRGLCYFYINKYDDAIIDYTKAIRLRELNCGDSKLIYKVYCNRGTIFQFQKHYEKAICDFRKAIELEPEDYISIFNLGNCLIEIGNFTEALNCYEGALKLKPNDERTIKYRDNALKLNESSQKNINEYNWL